MALDLLGYELTGGTEATVVLAIIVAVAAGLYFAYSRSIRLVQRISSSEGPPREDDA